MSPNYSEWNACIPIRSKSQTENYFSAPYGCPYRIKPKPASSFEFEFSTVSEILIVDVSTEMLYTGSLSPNFCFAMFRSTTGFSLRREIVVILPQN